MLYALLFLPALAAIAFVILRRPTPVTIVEEAAVVAPPEQPNLFDSLEHLLAELERTTLDERDVDELERLAEQLEQTARELERVG